MSQVIRQGNGKLAVFSSTTDRIEMWDATASEVVEYFAAQAAEDSRQIMRPIVDNVINDHPEWSYGPRTVTWHDALRQDREHDGEAWREFGSNGDDDAPR